MACPASRSSISFPAVLDATEINETYPFTHPNKRDEDLNYMKAHLPRALSVLVNLISQQKRRGSKDGDLGGEKDGADVLEKDGADAKPKKQNSKIFLEFQDINEANCTMRYLVNDLERFVAQPKFFIIGFFGFKLETSTVVKQIWDLDDKLVDAIPTFEGILAYITIKKDDGQYFNYVFLESFEMVGKWREFPTHDNAVFYSPRYYSHVRINHAILPSTIGSLIENQKNINKLDIIRTKYYAYQNGQLVWSGLRVHKPDELHKSLPLGNRPRPYTFASFLGDNAFKFYSEIVSYIGKITGLPVVMIDVAALTKNITPRPSDLESIAKYNIDFAFTCGISYVNYFPNLVPLAAPVRLEERYQNKPIYFADIIVKSDSSIQTQEDLHSKVFVINEQVSLSGHLMPQHHFLPKGGLNKVFREVLESKSHANSINFVADGKADAAAIDSVVLDMEFKQKPERKHQIRIIESTAPCTMPPFVACASVPKSTQARVANAITQLHAQHAALLRENGFSQFAAVSDKDYDTVRVVRKLYHQINDGI